MPTVSVCITSYNQRAYLIEAIESVLAQSQLPDEIIVADDASTDGSQKVILDYARQYPGLIRYVFQDQNVGFPANKSDALRQVRTDLVTWLDGDDRYLPQKLEREVEAYKQRGEVSVIYANLYYIDPSGRRTGIWADPEEDVLPEGDIFCEVFARAFPKGSLFQNELIETCCLKTVGLFDPSLPIYVDWEWRIRMAKQYQAAYCPEPLVEYRRHPGGISNADAGQHLDTALRIVAKNRHLLDDLAPTERRMIDRRLRHWFGYLGSRAARQEAVRWNRRKALRYWTQAWRYGERRTTGRFIARLLLPRWLHARLRSLYHRGEHA